MKITNITPHVILPAIPDHSNRKRPWTFVQIDTDEGITGWGEASNWPGGGSHLSGGAVRLLKNILIGEDPSDIERLWHKVYRQYTYLGARGLPTVALSGIDIALWDIKGKATNRPVYDLLGGKFRDSIKLYANSWFVGCQTPGEFAEAAKNAVASGHEALKLDPFLEMRPYHTGYVDGQISAAGENLGCDIVSAIREAVGPDIEILIDAHGHYNVPTAIRLGNRLYEESRIFWFEEPVPPESFDALRTVREHTSAPICTGERLFTRFDFIPLFQDRLTDFIMPDVVWTGGISELKKISTLSEAYYIPVSPHNAMGPLQIVAGAHVMMTVPNFYRLEHGTANIPYYNAALTEPIAFQGGEVHLSDRPGLGTDLNLEYIQANIDPDWV